MLRWPWTICLPCVVVGGMALTQQLGELTLRNWAPHPLEVK
jgi:hypothetical protein